MKKLFLILISTIILLGCTDSRKPESANTKKENREIEQDKMGHTGLDQDPKINRLQFSIDIYADKEKIWKALWDDQHYRDWSGVFGEGAHFVLEQWEEGSKIMFLSSDRSGIYSVIEKHIPNQIIRFKHIGTVVEGEEQPIDEETKQWSGATETYKLIEGPNYYTLLIDIDVLDEHVDFMSNKLPIALEKIKNNSR